jgi:hypothetical protein
MPSPRLARVRHGSPPLSSIPLPEAPAAQGAPPDAPASATAALRRVATLSALAVPLVIALDVCAMWWLSARLNVWVDEAYTLHTASSSLAATVHQSLFWELQPPVYFVLIWLLRQVSTSIALARLFSIGCVALTLWLAALISRRLFPDQHPAWLVAALAVNPLVVSAAVEIRVYALVLLLSALLTYLFLAGYLDGDSRRARIGYVAVAVIALYTQYYLGFVLAAFACVLALLRRWRALGAYLAGMAIVALCASPIAFVLGYQIASNTVNYTNNGGEGAGILHLSKILGSDVLGIDDWLTSQTRWLIAASCLVITIAAAIAWRARRAEPRQALAMPLLAVAAGGALFAIVVTLAHQPITARYSIGLFPVALLCVYAAFALLPINPRLWLLAGWTALVGTTGILTLSTEYRDLAKIGDWQRVASYIQANERPGEPIITFESQASLPLAIYYHGPNKIVPLPRPMDFQRYDLRTVALHSPSDVSRVFDSLAPSDGNVWLVTTDFCRRVPIDFKCDLLDRYVAQHYVVLSNQAFYWSRVKLLARIPSHPNSR